MDEVETRGCWNVNTLPVVSGYVNVEQPHIEAKVESILCVGGPVSYKLIAECGITAEWIYKHVVPGIYKHFGTTDNNNTILPEILGLALLWTCCKESQQHLVQPQLLQKIIGAYSKITTNKLAINKVQKVCLAVCTVPGQVCIDQIITEEGGQQPSNLPGGNQITQEDIIGKTIQL
jgi:hypothetical protein